MRATPLIHPSADTSREFVRLIDRIRCGDERALEKLLAAVAIPLRRMADRLIGSSLRPHLDAEDLVQAVSLILWRGLQDGKFEVAGPRQLMRLSATLLKRQTARAVRRLKSALALTSSPDINPGATLVDLPIFSVNYVTEQVERHDQIRHLMTRVDANDRRLLELMLLGHSIAAAARLLNVEPPTLRMRLSRLRVRLRRVRRADETVW